MRGPCLRLWDLCLQRWSHWGGRAHSCVQTILSGLAAASTTRWHHSHRRESERPSRSVSLPLQRSLLQRAGGVWTSARNRVENWQLKTTEAVGCLRPLWRQLPLLKARSWEGATGEDRRPHPIITSSPLLGVHRMLMAPMSPVTPFFVHIKAT